MESDASTCAVVVRQRGKRVDWSAAVRRTFLDHLAESCNVTLASAAIGVSPGSAHQLRRRDPGFAAEWETALELGYVLLETRILGHVLGGAGRLDAVAAQGGAACALHFEEALRVLSIRDARKAGRVGGHPVPKRATIAETNKLILAKLRAIDARAVKP